MSRYVLPLLCIVAIAVVAWAAEPTDLADDTATPMPSPAAPPTVQAEIVNFPPIQTVDGTVSVDNFPEVQGIAGAVEVTNLPGQQEVVGTVAVSNLPPVQEVAGTVAVSNLEAGPSSETIIVQLGAVHFDSASREWESAPFNVGSYAAMSIGFDRSGDLPCAIAWQWFEGGPFIAADVFASNKQAGIVRVHAPRARIDCIFNGGGSGVLRSVAVYLDRTLVPDN